MVSHVLLALLGMVVLGNASWSAGKVRNVGKESAYQGSLSLEQTAIVHTA